MTLSTLHEPERVPVTPQLCSSPLIEKPLSAQELAPILGLHPVTLLRWAREDRIPHRKLSVRKIVFLPSDIQRWLATDSNLYAGRVGHAA